MAADIDLESSVNMDARVTHNMSEFDNRLFNATPQVRHGFEVSQRFNSVVPEIPGEKGAEQAPPLEVGEGSLPNIADLPDNHRLSQVAPSDNTLG